MFIINITDMFLYFLSLKITNLNMSEYIDNDDAFP